MSIPTVCLVIFSSPCACHASLDAHVSIQDVGKDGGDHTPVRPLTAKRPSVRPPSLLRTRSGSLRSPLRVRNSPGLPRDPDLQIKRPYPRMEQTSDPPFLPPGSALRGCATYIRAGTPWEGRSRPKYPCGKAVEATKHSGGCAVWDAPTRADGWSEADVDTGDYDVLGWIHRARP